MNYRHAFHAGNFADVVKHATLARIIAYLKEKPAAFRVIDTHAGAGIYDLTGPEASRTAEWRAGIGKLLAAPLAPAARALLAPYLDAVAAFNSGAAPTTYPGSPALAQYWLREQDRLILCEAEPNAARTLGALMGGDARVRTVAIDGYAALNAYVPPKERRGLVLIDPPYEAVDEFDRLGAALAGAHRKWPTGVYMLWYPVKNKRATEGFARGLSRRGIPRILRAEVALAGERAPLRLGGSGLVIVNPPWTLEDELAVLLPALVQALGGGRGASRLNWLAREK